MTRAQTYSSPAWACWHLGFKTSVVEPKRQHYIQEVQAVQRRSWSTYSVAQQQSARPKPSTAAAFTHLEASSAYSLQGIQQAAPRIPFDSCVERGAVPLARVPAAFFKPTEHRTQLIHFGADLPAAVTTALIPEESENRQSNQGPRSPNEHRKVTAQSHPLELQKDDGTLLQIGPVVWNASEFPCCPQQAAMRANCLGAKAHVL
ncbi:hypothetical protein Emed_007281 [Eimeria media]